MSARLARFYVLAAAVLFSTGGAAIKLSTLTSWQIAGLRSGIAALLLWTAVPSWRRSRRPGVLAVALAYAATLILYVTANTLTTAANSIFLQASAPLYLLLFGPRLLGERNRRSDWAFVAVLGLGLGLFFVGREPPLRTAPDPFSGNVLAALSGLTWAFTLLGLRALGRERDPPGVDSAGTAVVAGNAIAFLICLAFALPLRGAGTVDWILDSYLGLFQIGLAYLCMIRGVREVRALEVSLLLVLEPVLNAVWAWLLHGERPGPWSLAGCTLVGIGVVLQALRTDRREPAR